MDVRQPYRDDPHCLEQLLPATVELVHGGAPPGLRRLDGPRTQRARPSSSLGPWEAVRRFTLRAVLIADPEPCHCGEIVKGVKRAWACTVFTTACTPETFSGMHGVFPRGRAASCLYGPLHGAISLSAAIAGGRLESPAGA